MLLPLATFRDLDREKLIEFVSLGHHEGAQLEFKEALPKRWTLLKEVTGFANADGGMLILGAKEPQDGLSTEGRLVGISDGREEAHRLERVFSSCIEPRIPGLLVNPVELQDGLAIIVVRVPPSLSQPHIATYDRKREFFMRHSESTEPMTWFEIREAALRSATAEETARRRCAALEEDFHQHTMGGDAAIVVQAEPVLRPEGELEISRALLSALAAAVCPGPRSMRDEEPSLYGHLTRVENLSWNREFVVAVWEVRRRGGLIAGLPLSRRPAEAVRVIDCAHEQFFGQFSRACEAVVSEAGSDPPFLLRSRCFKVAGSGVYFCGDIGGTQVRDSFELDEKLRQPGESFSVFSDRQWRRVLNAWGLK